MSCVALLGSLLASGLTTTANASDDATREVGAWGIGDYGDTDNYGDIMADDDAEGFVDGIADNTDYDTQDLRQNDSCYEVHLKEYGNGNGNDLYSFDKSDIVYFGGHGTYHLLVFNTALDGHFLSPLDVRWGNDDGDWMMIGACYWMGNNSSATYFEWDKEMMAGLHSLHGYCVPMEDVGYEHGYDIGECLAGDFDGDIRTFRYTWKRIEGWYQDADKTVRSFHGEGCDDEYVPGIGSYHMGDPEPYPDGDLYVETTVV